MQKKYYMRKWELICVILNLCVYKTVTGYSRIFAELSGPSSAITAVVTGGAAYLVIWGLLSLYKKEGSKTILEIAEAKTGSGGKYALFTLLLVYLLLSSIVNLRETGEFIKAVSLPTAPLTFVFFIIVAGAVLCCAQGFDALGRAHSLIVPIALSGVVIITVFSFKNGEISNLFPYLGYGAESTFLKGFSAIGLYGDLIILLLLAPFSSKETDFKKTALGASAVGIIINITIILACTMATPYNVARGIEHPFHQLVKLFSVGSMLQRTDGYFMYLTAMCSILSLALNLFFASYMWGRAFKLPKIRPLCYPLGMIIIFGGLLFQSRESAYMWGKNYLWIWFAVIFTAAALTLILPKRRKNK